MSNFKIGEGTIIESENLGNIYNALSALADNTRNDISPRDARDALLTFYAQCVFKVTKSDSFEYIGIDTSNPKNRDIKAPILIGNRDSGGSAIMTNTRINSDSDIFLYTTSSDSDRVNTKISILAGEIEQGVQYPYIEANKPPNSNENNIDLNIINPQGRIDINSGNGRVAINGIRFPKTTMGDNIDGKILKYFGVYPHGHLIWSDPVPNNTSIGGSGPTNITGAPITINGLPGEFINDMEVCKKVGGIDSGDKFTPATYLPNTIPSNPIYPPNAVTGNWGITSVLHKLLYPEMDPEIIKFEANPKYIKAGSTETIEITLSIIPRHRNIGEIPTFIIYTGSDNTQGIVSGFIPIPTDGTQNPGAEHTTQSNSSISTTTTYKLYISTISTDPFKTITVEAVDPIYYGFYGVKIDNLTKFNDYVGSNPEEFLTSEPTIGETFTEEIHFAGSGYLTIALPWQDKISKIYDIHGILIFDRDDNPHPNFTSMIEGNYQILQSRFPISGYNPSEEDKIKIVFDGGQ